MSLGDKLKNMNDRIQTGAKNATQSLVHTFLRLISGFLIGFVLALIFQELFVLGQFMLVFLTLLFMSVIYKILSNKTLLQIVIFDVICILIGSLLKMYVIVGSR